MGLMIARKLIVAGKRVALYDRGKVGAESSWAGGGILTPLYPWRQPQLLTTLTLRSQALYPELVASLIKETSIDPELERSGMLVLAADDVAEARSWAGKNRVKVQVADHNQVGSVEPHLNTSLDLHGLLFPEIGHIRNPRLVAALYKSLLLEGCEIHEQSEITHLAIENRTIKSFTTTKGKVETEKVIVCTGAWTGQLLSKIGQQIPVEPVAGQMLLYKAEPGLIRNIILKDKRYLIPRRDGRILVGSTIEYSGFNKRTTAEARQSLEEFANTVIPEISRYPVEAQWSGLRPGAPLGIPFMGVYPNVENLWVCAGHYRSGLILAPASAEFMVDLILNRETFLQQPAFALDRAS